MPARVYNPYRIFRQKRHHGNEASLAGTAFPAGIYRNAGIQLRSDFKYSAVVERYDWPLPAVFLLTVLSIALILGALRAAVELLAGMYLRLGIWRQTRLMNNRVSP